MNTRTLHASLAFLRRGATPVAWFCLAFGLFGCLAVYNATYHLAEPFELVGRQLLWLAISMPTLVVVAAIPATAHRRLLPYYCALAFIPLLLVLFFGIRVNGMRGWFAWRGVFYQPGEMAKPAFALCLAWMLEQRQAWRNDLVRGFLPAFAVLLAWTFPLVLQPDFGAVLVYALTFALVYACMGGRFQHLGLAVLIALPFCIWVVASHPYVLHRLLGFIAPDHYPDSHGWHIIQFRRSLASGGLVGQSWGKGQWSQTYLPLGYSDSIFATLGESIGFLGTLPFVLVVVAWVFYGYRRVRNCASPFNAAAILGLVGYLAIQTYTHLSVNLGLMPPTGITLPLISYGGSSLLSTAIAIGLVESLARPANPPQPAETARPLPTEQ